MPTRYIKESSRTSKNLSVVSDFAERLFWRLITTADDFGRFLACPVIVKNTCFPTLETIKLYKVEHAIAELHKNELIGRYVVGDRHYGWFVNWEKHQGKPRAIASKYPEIPLEFLQSPASVGICMQPPTKVPGAPDTDTDTDTSLSSLNSLSSSDSEFEQFWTCYPRKVAKKAARKAWEKAKDKPPLAEIITVIEQAKRSAQWLKEHGQFIPHPATWMNEGRWSDQLRPRLRTVVEEFLDRHQGE